MPGLLKLYDLAVYLLSVPKCVYCGEILDFGDKALCKECLKLYNEQKLRNCSRCAKPIPECTCSNFYLEKRRIKKLIKVYRYRGYTKDLRGNSLIFSLKEDNRRDVFDFLSDELSASISMAFDPALERENIIITNVPRRQTSINDKGYDHALVLAKRVAKKLGLRYESLLRSASDKAQKETRGRERIENAKYLPKRGKSISLKGKTVILIDDIVTTGSSMAASGEVLHLLGAKRIVGACLAIAYRDSFIKPYRPLYN